MILVDLDSWADHMIFFSSLGSFSFFSHSSLSSRPRFSFSSHIHCRYLTADYSVKCFESAWNDTAALAYPCIVFFVVGIPAVQFFALCWNRKYLDESTCVDLQAHRRHIRVKRKYGSIFDAYTPQYYYFDLIDLLRRLLLTGGLVVAGSDQAVAQLLLGMLISALWLFAILYLRPYKSSWDTLLSSVLALVVMLALACGMALKLYQVTLEGSDDYQRSLFGAVMTTTVILTLVGGTVAIVLSFDCMQNRVAKLWQANNKGKEQKNVDSSTKVAPVSSTKNSVNESKDTLFVNARHE